MSARVFLDTNILVYSDDLDAGAKRNRARAIIEEAISKRTAVISTQVLQEFFVISTRKLGVDAAIARRKVVLLTSLDVVEVNVAMVLGAIDLHRLHQISLWDAMIIRAAAIAGCKRVLTEDLNHGQIIDGVRIEDPFRTA